MFNTKHIADALNDWAAEIARYKSGAANEARTKRAIAHDLREVIMENHGIKMVETDETYFAPGGEEHRRLVCSDPCFAVCFDIMFNTAWAEA
jgi:hypothetical protein